MTYKSSSSDGKDLSAQPGTTAEVKKRCSLCGIHDGQIHSMALQA